MALAPKKCKSCGKIFLPRRRNHIYCKPSCNKKNYRSRPKAGQPRICRICGREFFPQLHATNQKFCSLHKNMKRKPTLKPKKEKTCLMCKKKFMTSRLTREFCGSDCRTLYGKLQKRIFNLYWDEERDSELEKLKRLGKDFRFSAPNLSLNFFYELEKTRKR